METAGPLAEERFDMGAGALCLNFVNTRNYRGSSPEEGEELGCLADWIAWCLQSRILSPHRAEDFLRRASRDAKGRESALLGIQSSRDLLFRILSAAAANQAPERKDLAAFNRVLSPASACMEVVVEDEGFCWRWELPERLDSPLAPILHSAAQLLTCQEELQRLRECAASNCGWLFLDRTRNRSRRWCDMRVCGNRDKVRRFRRRQAAKS